MVGPTWESIAPIELSRSIAYVDLDFLRTHYSAQFYLHSAQHALFGASATILVC
jgi:hypothetical protein